jgi:hypothetical protein
MTKRLRLMIPVRVASPSHALSHLTVALLAAGLITACSSSDTSTPTPKKDSAADSPSDLLVNNDLGPDLVSVSGCSANGLNYTVGQTVVLAGDCPITCKCLSGGTLGQCAGGCIPDGAPPDIHPSPDGPTNPDTSPVTCNRAGKTYSPGEAILLNDACGGYCICMANGTVGACTGPCPVDGGPDAPLDAGPDTSPDKALDHGDGDAPVDRPVDLAVDTVPVDTACASGAPCALASGGKGLCSAGTCKACAGAQDDGNCSTIYGAGNICAAGECVAGTCHDSTACTGSKVCDATHTCRNCASDLQCQNDATYGRGTICLSTGVCTAGTCHASTDCQGKKLCDSALHTCDNCSTDTQCQADTVYGNKSICVSGQCNAGTCAATADCKSIGRLCPTATKVCTECTTDAQCKGDTAYGAATICVSGQCVSGTCNNSSTCPAGRTCNTTSHACVACANDNQCKNDAVYGQHTICLAGLCTTGDCHDISSDCSAGRICGSTVPHACGDCNTDAQCKQDARYQTGYICVGNLCAQGDCHDTSNDCTATRAGLVCGADVPHTCGTCADDDQCKNDTKYGANTICTITTGLTTTGECVSNICSNANAGKACAANGADVCCGTRCIPGNCCTDSNCQSNPIYGDGYFCRQNTCSRCDNITGNAYLVDPVGGDDSVATGSGTAGGGATVGCSFRTVTRALQAIGGTAPAGTTITILGRTTGTTLLYTVPATGDTSSTETLPIQVPANVTITTKTGPVKLTLGNNKVGFSLLGDQANLQPIAAAALTIDGTSHISASGIVVNAGGGTVNIGNVTVTNTGDDGIQVTAGTAQIGAGVHVTYAGTATSRQSGLLVSGGTANIAVLAADPNTTFENNTQSGILVSGAGVIKISGAATTDGKRSVIAQNNYNSNVDFSQTPVAGTNPSTIDGLYSWVSTQGDGLRILAGTQIKVRNSVFQGNIGNGIHIASAGASAAANNLAGIDLGVTGAAAGNAGHNVLQTVGGNNPNIGAGLCVDLATGAGAQTLQAVGNQFALRDCSAAAPGAITTSTSCTAAVNLGVIPFTGTTVTVNTSCN